MSVETQVLSQSSQSSKRPPLKKVVNHPLTFKYSNNLWLPSPFMSCDISTDIFNLWTWLISKFKESPLRYSPLLTFNLLCALSWVYFYFILGKKNWFEETRLTIHNFTELHYLGQKVFFLSLSPSRTENLFVLLNKQWNIKTVSNLKRICKQQARYHQVWVKINLHARIFHPSAIIRLLLLFISSVKFQEITQANA